MPKHAKPDRDTAALFVRLPLEESEKLDRVAFRLKTPKREVIRHLLSELDPERADVLWERPAPTPVTAPLPDAGLVVGRAEALPAADVLDVAGVAALLDADESAVVELAEAGELPGRRVGGEWRFLRAAVLAWLGGT